MFSVAGTWWVQELQKAAKRTAEEHQRLQQAADAATKQAQHLAAASAADADKISALKATLLYQEAKYQVRVFCSILVRLWRLLDLMLIHMRVCHATAGTGHSHNSFTVSQVAGRLH